MKVATVKGYHKEHEDRFVIRYASDRIPRSKEV